MRRLIAVLLLAAAGCSQPAGELPTQTVVGSGEVSSGSAVSQAEVIGGDEAGLREFIQRALTYQAPSDAQGVQVLIGALPEDLPLDLPLPAGTRVVGSIVRGAMLGGTEVILDVEMAPEDVLAFYQGQLSRAGWEPAPEPPYGGGFRAEPWPSATYCLPRDEAQIYLTARAVPGGPADVRLNLLSTLRFSACDPQVYNPQDEGSSMIPELTTSGGAVMVSSGGSGGDGTADTSATLSTTQSPDELAEQYSQQLLQAGWSQIYQEVAQELSWSTWTTTDEQGRPWAGLLLVADRPLHADQVFAWFRVERGD